MPESEETGSALPENILRIKKKKKKKIFFFFESSDSCFADGVRAMCVSCVKDEALYKREAGAVAQI